MKIDICNTTEDAMPFYLEPEGMPVSIPSKKTFQLELSGNDPVGLLNIIQEKDGKTALQFWPDEGTYKLSIDGKDAWDYLDSQSDEGT